MGGGGGGGGVLLMLNGGGSPLTSCLQKREMNIFEPVLIYVFSHNN